MKNIIDFLYLCCYSLANRIISKQKVKEEGIYSIYKLAKLLIGWATFYILSLTEVSVSLFFRIRYSPDASFITIIIPLLLALYICNKNDIEGKITMKELSIDDHKRDRQYMRTLKNYRLSSERKRFYCAWGILIICLSFPILNIYVGMNYGLFNSSSPYIE